MPKELEFFFSIEKEKNVLLKTYGMLKTNILSGFCTAQAGI
jgi:hypothetical protein